MRSQPEIVCAHLPVVLALAQSRIRECLAVRIDKLVLLQLVIEERPFNECPWVLDPKRMVGDGIDLIRRLTNPALAPGIYDSMVAGRSGM